MLLKGKASLLPSASPWRPEASQKAAGPPEDGHEVFPENSSLLGSGDRGKPSVCPSSTLPLEV